MKCLVAGAIAICCLLGWFVLAGCQVGWAPSTAARRSEPVPAGSTSQRDYWRDEFKSFSKPEPPADVFPTPIVVLRGDGGAMGAAHGRQLGESIRLLHDRYLGSLLPNSLVRMLALAAAGKFESHFLPEHREELESLAREAGMEEREVALEQCFLDLLPVAGCSTIALPSSAAPDGVARFGRDLDFASFGVADRYSTVFIYHPAGRYAFASVGWPGQMGVLSGMNEHGLTLANMEVDRMPRLPSAMPYTLLYRMVLERCRTTDEAIALLRSTPRQSANNLMIIDAAGDRAVAEITPEGVTVRRAGPDAALISTNHQRGLDADTPGRCDRYDLLHERSRQWFGRIDLGHVEQLLAGASPGRPTMQSMVFEPANRVIYLSACDDAANARFYRLDFKPYFGS